MDTSGPDILGHFLLQYRDFPLSVVKNILVTPVGTKIFAVIVEVSAGFVKRGSTVYI